MCYGDFVFFRQDLEGNEIAKDKSAVHPVSLMVIMTHQNNSTLDCRKKQPLSLSLDFNDYAMCTKHK